MYKAIPFLTKLSIAEMNNFATILLLVFGILCRIPSEYAIAFPITSSSDPVLNDSSVIDFGPQTIGKYTSLTIVDVTFSAGAETFRIENRYSGQYNTSGKYLENTFSGFNSITFSFSSNVDAFGFNWGASDTNWTLTAYDSWDNPLESYNIPAIFSSNSDEFFGLAVNDIAYATLLRTGPLPRLSFVDIAFLTLNLNDWIFIDNFSYKKEIDPIPEPATIFLLGSGLVGVLGFRRKFRNK